MNEFQKFSLLALCVGASTIKHTCAAVAIDSSSTNWTEVAYGSVSPEQGSDQQTGSAEADLVGTATAAYFFTNFDEGNVNDSNDGTLAFRARVGRDKSPSGFSGALFVGIDASGNGALDAFVGVNNSGATKKHRVLIYDAVGADNDSPSSLEFGNKVEEYSILSSNYNFRPVTTSDVPSGDTLDADGGGQTDYYVSFSLPFGDLVAVLAAKGVFIDDSSPLRYVVSTATQANSFNQDIGGVGVNYSELDTWDSLGATSSSITADGDSSIGLIPEPATSIYICSAFAAMMLRRSRANS